MNEKKSYNKIDENDDDLMMMTTTTTRRTSTIRSMPSEKEMTIIYYIWLLDCVWCWVELRLKIAAYSKWKRK